MFKNIFKQEVLELMKSIPVNRRQAEEVSKIFKSFSHPARLLMLCKLSEGASTVQELQSACGLDQAPTSQFLARLKAEGRVTCERSGNQMVYTLADERLIELMKTLYKLYCQPIGKK